MCLEKDRGIKNVGRRKEIFEHGFPNGGLKDLKGLATS